MSETTLDEMDALLDGTLDDLADIPEMRIYPVGAHKIKMGWKLNHTIDGVFAEKGKESSGLKKFIQFHGVAIETVELPAGSSDSPLDAGTQYQELFDLKNEWAQGAFKNIMKALAQHYGPGKTNRQLMVESEGAEVVITIKHRKDKNKKQDDGSAVVYAQLDNLMVV